MSEQGMRSVEERLRAAGRADAPPDSYGQLARAAALGAEPKPREARVIGLPSRHRISVFRALLAAAVIAVSVAGALVIGVGGDRVGVEHTVALSGDSGATGSVDIGREDGPVRAVVLRVDGLDPAPEGQYYEMWFAYNGESMPLVAFNTSDDGSVEVRGAMPAGMGWENCWITLEGDGSRPPATVLKAS